jgi:phage terminase large subunit-like protein
VALVVNAQRRIVFRASLIAAMRAQQEALKAAALAPKWEPMAHQVAPEGDWDLWLMLAGRGSGKTDAGAHFMNEHALGPPCDPRVPGGHRMGIVAPTLGDAAAACVEGVSGIKTHNPKVRMVGRIGGQYVVWPNGARARLFSAENKRTVDRLRAGGNRCLDWWEELAAWPELKEGIDQAQFGLRMGAKPRTIATTTPKPRKPLEELIADSTTQVTHASTDDNPHLPEKRKVALYKRYGATEKGKQELGGRMMKEAEGALWKRAWIDKWRLPVCDSCKLLPPPGAKHNHPDFIQAVIAVDPSGGDDVENDEQGIGAAAMGRDGRVYVLEDATTKQDPSGWGQVVVDTYKRWRADHVAAETNYGGAMVTFVIRTANPNVPVRMLTASRGKAIRAEPVSSLYANGYVSHMGDFPDLEDELCQWTPHDDRSPNRLDWLVWAVTDLYGLDEMTQGEEYLGVDERYGISPV